MEKTQTNDVQTLKKHVAAVHIHNVPLMQRKLHNVLMFVAIHSEPLKDSTSEYRISLNNLINLLGYNSKDITYLKNSLVNLSKNNVEWNLFDDGQQVEWGTAALLASARIRKGQCYFSFPAPLEQMLRNPELYAKIDLRIQRKFSSKYALALYENVIRYIKIGYTRWIDVLLLKKILGIDESESIEFKYLNRLLKKAIKSVNEESDLQVEVRYKRESRRMIAVQFLVERRSNILTSLSNSALVEEIVYAEEGKRKPSSKGTKKDPFVSDKGECGKSLVVLSSVRECSVDKELFNRLVSYLGFTSDEAQILVDQYGVNFIKQHLGEVEEKYREGHIRWVRPYLISVLKKSHAARDALIEKERQDVIEHKRRFQEVTNRSRKTEELEKQLEKDYLIYRAKKLEAIIHDMNPNSIEDLDKHFAEWIKGTPHYKIFKSRGFDSPIICSLYDNFITEKFVVTNPELSREWFLEQRKDRKI